MRVPDGERTPCYSDPYPFDVLLDLTRGPEYQHALLEAASLCGRCKVRAECHEMNATEAWVPPVRQELARRVRQMQKLMKERE